MDTKKLIFKNLTITVCVIILTIGFLILLKKSLKPEESNFSQNQQNQDNNNQGTVRLNSEIVEEKVVASNGEGFPHFVLKEGSEELIMAIYPYTTIPDKSLEDPGFLIFKYDNNNRVQKIWQNKEHFPFGIGGVSFSKEDSLRDLNKDGIKELIVEAYHPTGRNSVLWIYTWINGEFKYIGATDPKEGPNVFQTAPSVNLQFIDLEDDGKIEISLLYRDYVRTGPDREDLRIDIYKRIYKWDGAEKPYYLWKEEKIGEEKPEPIE